MHPDYPSTRFAREITKTGSPRLAFVQHHLAHVFSCVAENEVDFPALGVAWDGTGWGAADMIWGGEFFELTESSSNRIAHLRPFRLPGGEKAVREPRRVAAALLCDIYDRAGLEELHPTMFSPRELPILRTMLEHGINSPLCCSVGRLFDGVSALIGLRQRIEFEGQAAMDLEFAMEGIKTNEAYPLRCVNDEERSENGKPRLLVDWHPLIEAILSDRKRSVPSGEISARFHNALVEVIVMVAKEAAHSRVVLSGGCFQNRYLTERTVTRLREEGFQPYWPQRVPPNDGGIALGQIAAAWRTNNKDNVPGNPWKN
jgi:hydrogenase maturation protein HypF